LEAEVLGHFGEGWRLVLRPWPNQQAQALEALVARPKWFETLTVRRIAAKRFGGLMCAFTSRSKSNHFYRKSKCMTATQQSTYQVQTKCPISVLLSYGSTDI
jgi:hypothetical protein